MNAIADAFTGAAASLLRLRVESVRDIAADIRLFELFGTDGNTLPSWTPGAHIRLQLGDALARSYSLCNSPLQHDRYVIAVKRETTSRGGSSFLHEHVRAGDLLLAAPPANAFALEDSIRAPLLLAAGIGITPIYAMATALAHRGASCRTHYFARSLGHAAFVAELAGLSSPLSLHLGLNATHTTEAIAALLAAASDRPPLYICGPAPFIDAVRSAAQRHGWRDADVHFELFAAPAGNSSSGAVSIDSNSGDSAFELVLQRSGRRCTVPPGQSIVAAAAQVGVHIGTSCGEGFCGSCESTVLDGVPLHRDSVLSASQRTGGKRILPCVSRCAGPRLVLDL